MQNWHYWFTRFIGVLFIYGGVTGALKVAPSTTIVNTPLFFFVYYLCCVFAGIFLLENNRRVVFWAKVLLLLQIPIVSSAWFSYHLSVGMGISLKVTWPTFKLGFEQGAYYGFALYKTGRSIVGVNLLAIMMLLFLHQRMRSD